MEAVTMSGLLKADEEKLRSELKADALYDKDRKQSAVRLDEAFSKILLRYNAACTDDPMRQALADCQTAAVRDMLALLTAGTAQKEISKRRFRTGALITLLLAVIFGLVAALLIKEYYLVGCALVAAAALCAFLAGRLWYGEREVRVRAGLDPEVVWRTLKKTAETVDRKAAEFLDLSKGWQQEAVEAVSADGPALDGESLKLVGDLLEALYAENGDYALRQLRQLLPWLRRQGIEVVNYSADSAELFELLPTKKAAATQRPALVSDGKLLLVGRATEHIDG
ncbi:MAG: hypothetical protein IJ179_06745 [Oscillospiraceae bacterium]|nr:hypothetical protein [Oscillospiraceae bacterium]